VAVLRQSYPAFKARSAIPDSNSYAFTQVTQGGLLFNGWLKGSVINVLQFAAVTYPALYFANRTSENNKFLNFTLFYTLFDFLLYPLDRARTLLYSDYAGVYKSKNRVSLDELSSLSSLGDHRRPRGLSYTGVGFKLAYNLPWFWTVHTTVNESSPLEKALAWGTLALTYPLTTMKTVMQVNEALTLSYGPTSTIPFGLYRGLVPFLLANAIAHITLYNLTGASKKHQYGRNYVQEATLFKPDSMPWFEV
jgi:hypothetical protein